MAEKGQLEPFVLVVEGSIPNEKIKKEGYWAAFGNNPATGEPVTTSEWLTRLAPKATAILISIMRIRRGNTASSMTRTQDDPRIRL